MKLKTLLIDDEQHCLDTLSYDLNKHCAGQIEILGTAANAIEATAQINRIKPDLIFLDIELPGMSGIQLLESIGSLRAKLVFTTAYSQYAIEGYKFNASGYLLKPVDKDELIDVVLRIHREQQSQLPTFDDKLSLRDAQGTEFIEFSEIRLCEASNNYTIIHFKNDQQKIASKTLKNIQNELPSNQFIRIHQSYIVNIAFIKKYLKSDGGTVELDNGKRYSVSKSYRESFLSLFQ